MSERHRIGWLGWCCIFAAALLGIACAWGSMTRVEAVVPSVTFLFSDGSQRPGIAPRSFDAWGRRVAGYGLHPAISGRAVENGLEARFEDAPTRIEASFSKPGSAVFSPDGKPLPSDGVRIRATITHPDGSLSPEAVIDLPQADFLRDRWLQHAFSANEGIAALRIVVEGGPPGAHAYNDATIVALKATQLPFRAATAGKALLVGIGFAAFAWWLMACASAWTRGRDSVARGLRSEWPPLLVVAAGFLLVGGWSIVASESIYLWDSRNYWQKSELLHALVVGGDWNAYFASVANAHAQDYTMFPSILPAAVATLFDAGPTRVVYAMTVLVAYALTAYLALGWVASRFVPTQATTTRWTWAWALLAILVAVPAPMDATTLLMPDIGGIVLMVVAWSAAATMIRTCVEEDAARELAWASLLFGLTCAAMFLFRRWYVFAAAGLGVTTALLLLAEFIRARADRMAILRRAATAGVLVVASMTPWLCWVVIAWAADVDRHDFSRLYASYQQGAWHDLLILNRQFGVVFLLLAIAGLALAWPRARGDLRRRWWLLVGGGVIGFAAFLRVQSPGAQHLDLIVPCVAVGVGVVALRLAARFGVRAMIAFVLACAIANFFSMRPPEPIPPRRVVLFPGFGVYLPKRIDAPEAYRAMDAWLVAPAQAGKKVCVIASSAAFNESILTESWQIDPAMRRTQFAGRVLAMPQVDSRDGAPRYIGHCDIALVGDPFQFHLGAARQDNVGILREDLMSGRGVGSAFVLRKQFQFAQGVTLLAYERTRQVTDNELRDVVARWEEREARQAAP